MKPFISLDWGTTSFRAHEVDGDGRVKNRLSAPQGIMSVNNGAFEETLEQLIGDWDKSLPLVASGMITSRQGWIECPYVDCPAGMEKLAGAITSLKTRTGRAVHFITGLHYQSPTIRHDVLRGEETQVFGALQGAAGHFIAPGTHSKWITVEQHRIMRFATYMTGETFALLRNNSILSKLMKGENHDAEAFGQGVAHSLSDPAGLLHQLFAVRARALFDDLAQESLHSYLSGLLIGCEVAHATKDLLRTASFVVLGAPAVSAAYVQALRLAGFSAGLGDPQCAIAGQRLIAQKAGLI